MGPKHKWSLDTIKWVSSNHAWEQQREKKPQSGEDGTWSLGFARSESDPRERAENLVPCNSESWDSAPFCVAFFRNTVIIEFQYCMSQLWFMYIIIIELAMARPLKSSLLSSPPLSSSWTPLDSSMYVPAYPRPRRPPCIFILSLNRRPTTLPSLRTAPRPPPDFSLTLLHNIECRRADTLRVMIPVVICMSSRVVPNAPLWCTRLH